MQLVRLVLTDFRNYTRLVWQPAARLSVITGPNGTGKTNLLEAVSLLAPGRGLRGARLAALARLGGSGALGRGRTHRRAGGRGGCRHRHRAGGALGSPGVPARRPGAAHAGGGGGAGRRGVADAADGWAVPGRRVRAAALPGPAGLRALEPGHAREINAHESAMAQRNRLLAQGGADPAWLAGLEDSMARHAVAAAAARRGLVARLNAALAGGAAGAFPAARLGLLDPGGGPAGAGTRAGGRGLAARGAGPRAGGGMRPPGRRGWGRIGPTSRCRTPPPGWRRRRPAPGSRRRCWSAPCWAMPR